MSDLSRTKSMAVVRADPIGTRTTPLLARSSSVPDLVPYTMPYSVYSRTAQWPSYYTYTSRHYPYRSYKDYNLYDDYWYDRYRYFSPLYHRSMFAGRRYFYTDSLPNPYYWNDSTYWTRYKSYLYDYTLPYGRYNYPYFNSYYTPYYKQRWDNFSPYTSKIY